MQRFNISVSFKMVYFPLATFPLYSIKILSFSLLISSSDVNLNCPCSISSLATISLISAPTFILSCSSSSSSLTSSYNFSKFLSWFIFFARSKAYLAASSKYFITSIIPFSTYFSRRTTFCLIRPHSSSIKLGGHSALFFYLA